MVQRSLPHIFPHALICGKGLESGDQTIVPESHLYTLPLQLPMASSSKLKILDVLNAVDSLNYEQTKDLFIRLGIELKVITDIEATNKGSSCIKHHTIQAWLDRDAEASWEKIVYGLEQIGIKVIARKVAELHCPHLVAATTPTIDSHQPVTVHPPQPIDTLAPLTPAMHSHVCMTSM